MPVFAAVFAFGPSILHKWLGPSAAHLDLSIRLLTLALAAHTLPGVATALAMGTGFVGLVVRYKAVLMLSTLVLLPPAARFGGIDGISGALLVGFVVSFFYLISKIQVVLGHAGRRQLELALLRATAATVAAVVFGLFAYWVLFMVETPYAAWFSASLAFVAYAALIVRFGLLDVSDVADLMGQPIRSRLLRFSRFRR